MHFRLHAYARQSYGVFNPLLVVDGVLLRDNVQNAMLVAHANRFRGMYHVLYIVLRHFFFRNRHHTDFILTADMLA